MGIKPRCFGKIGKIIPKLLAKGQVHPQTFGRVSLVLELSFFDSVTSLTPTPLVNAVCHTLFRPWAGQMWRQSLESSIPESGQEEGWSAAALGGLVMISMGKETEKQEGVTWIRSRVLVGAEGGWSVLST